MSKLPGHLAESARDRTARIFDSVRNATEIMEKEIKDADGIYPRNSGRLSLAEICRRANVHPITLMGKQHKYTTRVFALKWIERMSGSMIVGRAPIRRAITKRVTSAEDRYRLVVAEFQKMCQVEIPRRDDEIDALRREVSELKEENLKLQGQVTQGRVVRIKR